MSNMFVSVRDVARAFGVCLDTVRDWEAAGKIPAASRTPTNRRRWHVSALIPSLEAGKYPVPATWASASNKAAA
jgi:hypothetical protein